MQILSNTNFNFIKWRWHAITLSVVIVVAGLAQIISQERYDQPSKNKVQVRMQTASALEKSDVPEDRQRFLVKWTGWEGNSPLSTRSPGCVR